MISRKVRRNVLILIIIAIIAILLFMASMIYTSSKASINNLDDKVISVNNLDEYYDIKTCVNKFYYSLKDIYFSVNDFDGISNEEYKNKMKENLYKFLDTEYIELYKITKENISDTIPKVLNGELQINKICRIQKQDNISLYLVFAEQVNKKNSTKDKFNIALKINNVTNRFTIYLEDYIIAKGYDKLELNSKNKIELSNVVNNTFNNYSPMTVSEVTYIEDMFEDYRYSMLYNRERAYALLDNETKNVKFNTFEEYNKYVKENLKDMVTMKIETYNVTEQENYTDYNYIDTHGKEYIFRVTAPFTYTVILK